MPVFVFGCSRTYEFTASLCFNSITSIYCGFVVQLVFYTVVQQLTRFRLIYRVARSVCGSRASRLILHRAIRKRKIGVHVPYSIYWDCPRVREAGSIQTGWCPSVCPNPLLQVCCCVPNGQDISIEGCSSGVRWANAGSATLSAYVGS